MSRKIYQIHLRESAGLLDLALAVIDAGVSVTSIDDLGTHLPMVSRSTHALKVPVGQRSARGSVLTRVGVAQVALAEDARVNVRRGALEQAGGTGQEKLVLHDGGGGAFSDPGLNVVSLYPL